MVKHFVGSICALILNFTLFRGGKNEIIAVEALTTLSNHTDCVKSMAFHPTQPLLASGSGDKTATHYNTEDFTLLRTLSDHTSDVNSVAFHPTQPLLASGSYDKTVKIYNTEDFTLLTTLSDHTNCVRSVAFHPTQSLMASGSRDNTVNIYNIMLEGNVSRITNWH